jgi:hypothetical protein
MTNQKKVMGKGKGKKKPISNKKNTHTSGKKVFHNHKPLSRNLYFSNRKKYYLLKNRREKAKSRYIKRKTRKQAIQKASLYRYSVAFFNSKYDKTFRSEVYSDHELNEQSIQNQLIEFTKKRVQLFNKGVQKMFNQSSFIGLESERIGTNDLGLSSLNRMYFRID